MTSDLLASLAAMDDPIHVVVFDDNSKDGTAEKAAALGFPVFTTARMTGNTMNMNRAWKYFTSYEGLQSLFIMNNDISVAAGTFVKLHRCEMLSSVPGMCAAVVHVRASGSLLHFISSQVPWAP
jgi:glycosyltransferase involved in cell wall biosynthesis